MKTERRLIIIFLFFITLLFSNSLKASSYFDIVAEQSNYTKTSSYDDVMRHLFEVQNQTDKIHLARLTTTYEGRMIPLVIISKEGVKNILDAKATGKPIILIMANIHAGEIEGKEAMLMFTRDIVTGKADEYLENQIILVLPIFNADGNDKFGKNRGDNGPELAGVRYNGQNLDLNRDYVKLVSPEVTALVGLINQWDPVLVVDMHTTNGSYHRNPVTYATLSHASSDPQLFDYMWKNMFPEVTKTLKDKYGYDSIPYGNFSDNLEPTKGWENDTDMARYGTNYIGLRNRFTILDENYSHSDFKTRVLASYSFIKSILQYTNKNIYKMRDIVIQSDLKTRNSFYKEAFSLECKFEKLCDITIKSYEFIKEKIKPEDKDKYPPWIKDYISKRTENLKDYTVPYYGKSVSTRTVNLPQAYIITPFHPEILEKLKQHGIVVEKITKPFTAEVEIYNIKTMELAKQLYQGNVNITVKGEYSKGTIEIPQNSYLVSMKQPLARLIPVMLEPESPDSFVSWGFFNRELVEQWSARFRPYPVFRILEVKTPIQCIQD